MTVKRVAGGLVSNWFLDTVSDGSVLELTKPAGVFCPHETDRPVLGFCGGSGVTPVMSIAKQVLATSDRDVRLLYANRNAASVIFDDELGRLCARYPERFEVRHHLDADAGFLTADDVAAFAGATPDADVYICGPGPFMELVETTLHGLSVASERIFIERFLVEQQEKDAASRTEAAAETGGDSGGADVPADVTVILGAKARGYPVPAGRHPLGDGAPWRPTTTVFLRVGQLRHVHGLLEGGTSGHAGEQRARRRTRSKKVGS